MTGEEKIRDAFFTLLRAGLWGETPDGSCFPLQEKEWNLLYGQARKQTVEGIVYDGLLLLPDPYFPPRAVLLQWTAGVDALERRNKRMNRVIGEQNRWFEENGIEAWLLKGQGVAACYEQPLHRSCGDIDWYFPHPQDYEKTVSLLKEKGIRVERQAGFSLAYSWGGFVVEHHSRLLDIHNPLANAYLKRIIEKESVRPAVWEEAGMRILLPSPVLAHLLVNTHILKHMLAFGIGLRQLCDSARVCYRYQEVGEGVLLEKIYRRIGIGRWIQLLNRLLIKELGMPGACSPFPLAVSANPEWMLEEIWQGGNFGFYDRRFGQNEKEPRKKRTHVWRQWFHRMGLHFRYAPWETCWFPLVQVYSRIHIKTKNAIKK